MKIKYIPNLITLIRIIGSIFLLKCVPFSKVFLIIYIICGLSDVLDGYIARKTNTSSKTGQVLDSIADIVFIFVVFISIIPNISLSLSYILWIVLIAVIRVLSIIIGFIKYHLFSALHTYANKITGILLFFFPVLYILLGKDVAIIISCIVASLSSFEELLITITSKKLDRDIKGIFFI